MMFKQLCRLQRYTFLHELPNVFNTFLHELSSYAYTFLHELSSCTCTFLHELSSYYVHDNRFPILFIVVDCLHILPQFLVERMLRHRVLVAQDDELLQILHLGTIRRNDAYVDALLQYSLLAYLGEVFRQSQLIKMVQN